MNNLFKAWPKMPRLENEQYYITEKIDGTNACVIVRKECGYHTRGAVYTTVHAQSRSRIITPEYDNFGFAAWVKEHEKELKQLGEGYHYGEWWGCGIQRGYDLTEKRFSLFSWWLKDIPDCCYRVPIFPTNCDLNRAIEELKERGSLAAPGYMRPEGLVLTSKHYKTMYKVILDK